MGQTDGRRVGRQTVTLRLPLDAARVTIERRFSSEISGDYGAHFCASTAAQLGIQRPFAVRCGTQ